MLNDNDFQTWYLIRWQHNRQPIRRVRTFLLTNMEFNMDLLRNPRPSLYMCHSASGQNAMTQSMQTYPKAFSCRKVHSALDFIDNDAITKVIVGSVNG